MPSCFTLCVRAVLFLMIGFILWNVVRVKHVQHFFLKGDDIVLKGAGSVNTESVTAVQNDSDHDDHLLGQEASDDPHGSSNSSINSSSLQTKTVAEARNNSDHEDHLLDQEPLDKAQGSSSSNSIKSSSLQRTTALYRTNNNNNTVTVRIFNFNLTSYYSVMALAHDRFTVAAMQLNTPKNSSTLEFTLNFSFPGNYSVHVYETKMVTIAQRVAPKLVEPSPFDLAIHFRNEDGKNQRRPPCQSLPPGGLVPWYGEWIGPRGSTGTRDEDGFKKMRTGWSYVSRKCVLEIFDAEDMAATTEPTTIAFLGTSRERGIFLSMVDMALRSEEKQELATSKVGKCWGRASVQVNNLKLIYQDMRTQLLRPGQTESVTCHGDKLAQGSGMFQNATKMMNHLIETESPKVVVAWSACYVGTMIGPESRFMNAATTFSSLLHNLPPSWNGSLYVLDGFLSASEPAVTSNQFPTYLQRIRSLMQMVNDTRVNFLDISSLVSPMRLFAEKTGVILGSTHQHKWCGPNSSDMQVCSNVTEALAQLVLGRALAPNGKRHISPVAISGETNRTVEICTDCPKDLLPFHIIPEPNLTCYRGPFVSANQAGEPFFIPCPNECLEQEPTGEVQTQSGVIEERVCQVNSSS
eukprot:scaffold828_cov117-Amphora_coffeaeformis.AAC.4